MANKARTLKIAKKYFPRMWQDAVFPEIRLAGKWLQDYGFTCGQQVTVYYEENKIVITPQDTAQNTS